MTGDANSILVWGRRVPVMDVVSDLSRPKRKPARYLHIRKNARRSQEQKENIRCRSGEFGGGAPASHVASGPDPGMPASPVRAAEGQPLQAAATVFRYVGVICKAGNHVALATE